MRVEVVIRIGAAVLLAGCSRLNPAFDEASRADTDADTTAGPGPGSSATDASSGSGGTSASATTDPVTTADATTKATTGDTMAGEETSVPNDLGSSVCRNEADNAFGIAITDPSTSEELPCEDLELAAEIDIGDGGASLVLAGCDGLCPCAAMSIASYSVTLSEPLVPESASGCGLVRVWTELDLAGECEWVGFSIHPTDDGPPLFAASNRLRAPNTVLGGGPEWGDGEPCGDQACADPVPHPGNYPLSFGGVEAWPDDIPPSVPFSGRSYAFDNRMSHVTDACVESVSWWAALD